MKQGVLEALDALVLEVTDLADLCGYLLGQLDRLLQRLKALGQEAESRLTDICYVLNRLQVVPIELVKSFHYIL